jgi:hypothetical protein
MHLSAIHCTYSLLIGRGGKEGEATDSLYKPSIHPSQTMSYDIKASMTKKHQRTGPPSNQDQLSSRSSNEKDGSIEDRVNSLCVALAQEMDSSMNNRQAHRSMDGVRSSPAESMNHTQSLARKSPQPSTTILDVSVS